MVNQRHNGLQLNDTAAPRRRLRHHNPRNNHNNLFEEVLKYACSKSIPASFSVGMV
jgi:hypothetical protein